MSENNTGVSMRIAFERFESMEDFKGFVFKHINQDFLKSVTEDEDEGLILEFVNPDYQLSCDEESGMYFIDYTILECPDYEFVSYTFTSSIIDKIGKQLEEDLGEELMGNAVDLGLAFYSWYTGVDKQVDWP